MYFLVPDYAKTTMLMVSSWAVELVWGEGGMQRRVREGSMCQPSE